jgi:4-hydroxy-tetrahydrodipicolinate reductase
MIRVAVAGVRGRMGTLARTTVEKADDLTYVGGFERAAEPAERIYDDLSALFHETNPDVIVDFTVHPVTVQVGMQAVAHGVRPVIGATGWNASEREALAKAVDEHGIGGLLVPNFALGAILMMRFAEEAARFFPTVEIVELHHDEKKDAPSGTARLTAERIGARRRESDASAEKNVPIHSVRLRGLVAHQEVLFGGEGETLTIRHDSLSRESFASGILTAVRAVGNLRGLVVGLDNVLF